MPHISFEPGPGLAEYYPANFLLPHNPLRPVGCFTHYSGAAGVGHIVTGDFVLPSNPFTNTMLGRPDTAPTDRAAKGCGCVLGMCGCGHAAPGMGMGELGAFSLPQLDLFGLGNTTSWLIVGAGSLLALMALMPGGSQYRAGRKRLKQEYQAKTQALKGKFRGYQRAVRAGAGAVRKGAEQVMEAV